MQLRALLANGDVDVDALDACGQTALDLAIYFGREGCQAILRASGARTRSARILDGLRPIFGYESEPDAWTVPREWVMVESARAHSVEEATDALLRRSETHGGGCIGYTLVHGGGARRDVGAWHNDCGVGAAGLPEAEERQAEERARLAGECVFRAAQYACGAQLRAHVRSEGFDVDATDEHGRTALMVAALWNSIECAAVLIDAGANPAITDRCGDTPLIEARRRGHVQIAKLLEPLVAAARASLRARLRRVIFVAYRFYSALLSLCYRPGAGAGFKRARDEYEGAIGARAEAGERRGSPATGRQASRACISHLVA